MMRPIDTGPPPENGNARTRQTWGVPKTTSAITGERDYKTKSRQSQYRSRPLLAALVRQSLTSYPEVAS